MESTISRDAPFSLLLGVSPRLAESAAPAAFCCALDFAGIGVSPLDRERHTDADVPAIHPELRIDLPQCGDQGISATVGKHTWR